MAIDFFVHIKKKHNVFNLTKVEYIVFFLNTILLLFIVTYTTDIFFVFYNISGPTSTSYEYVLEIFGFALM